MKTTYESKKNTFSFSGQKSWLVSTNVDMILLFVKLDKTIDLSLNNRKTILNSILVPIYKETSATRTSFEKRKFLKQLNQGNLTLNGTHILAKDIISGKNIRGFGASEQLFVMLSLGIFFVTKVKNAKLKKIFFEVVKAFIIDFNTKKNLKVLIKYHNKALIKLIDKFDKLPEKRSVVNWNVDKIIFKNLLK